MPWLQASNNSSNISCDFYSKKLLKKDLYNTEAIHKR